MEYKFGKLEAIQDPRTIELKSFLKELPSYPEYFDVDSQYPDLKDKHMFGNDIYGDCVIAGRAHQTLRLEEFEQKALIPISENDAINEYLLETGGSDSGLFMIKSLNKWRTGWQAAGSLYNIYAYAKVDVSNQNEVMAAIYLLNGLYIGLLLPISARSQSTWSVIEGPAGKPGSWGSHCVYLVAYDVEGPTCVTWGARKKMTWEFFRAYCDEAFGIVDDKDNASSSLDVTALTNTLNEITGGNVPPPSPAPPKKTCWELLIDFIKKLFGRK